MTGGFAHLPGLGTERTITLALIDPDRAKALSAALDAVAFFARAEPGEGRVRPHVGPSKPCRSIASPDTAEAISRAA
ncbi:protealysin inhibitor emfourin [Sphingomonas sp. H160509]|uniref:protealysin inhibitor emfourin n=1 Tax=Sphingomonas sp. H160509 TaxID=2955313 RepID=UPI00406C9DC0